jgi:TctA family transporter
MNDFGRMLIVGGLGIAAVGVVLVVLGRFSGGGWLPGDIVVQRKHFTFFFPIVTCVVVSVVLTLILNLFFRR